MKQPTGKKSARPGTAAAAARAPRAAKPARAAGAPKAAEVEVTRVLRKKELVQRAAEVSGVKKKDVRDVIDAVLAEIGATLSRGEGLVLPPLGKAKVNRQMEKGTSEVLVVKLRRGGKGGPGGAPEEALADPDD